jgi:hypothetical protein
LTRLEHLASTRPLSSPPISMFNDSSSESAGVFSSVLTSGVV